MEAPDNCLLTSQAIRVLAPVELRHLMRAGSGVDLTDLVLVICRMVGGHPIPQRCLRANERLGFSDRLLLGYGPDQLTGYLVNLGEARPFTFQATFRLGDNVSELDTSIDLYFRVLDPEKIVRNLGDDPLRRLTDEVRAELRRFFKRIPRYYDVAASIEDAERAAESLGQRPQLGLALEKVRIDFQLPEHVRAPLGEIVKSQMQRDLEEQKRLDTEASLARLEAGKREAIRRAEIEIEIQAATLRANREVLDSQREKEQLEAEVEKERLARQMAQERQRKVHELELLRLEMQEVDPNNPVSLLLRDTQFRRSYLEMLHHQEMEKIKQLSTLQLQQMEQDKQVEMKFAEARLELIRNFLANKGEILERDDLERLLHLLDEGRQAIPSVFRAPLRLPQPPAARDDVTVDGAVIEGDV